ncbi:hypothetical protein L3N51_01062 [Metallosphaera sp. J1]|uniref:hypothetical protein n=1 Tax=Metallosphaera javensis (ex Hofmann et al. 2022) TaxID=99938 RepID=UPI001EDD9290|nr:hypothetical protein [Metallosphaera javensis (ex Hofmann et al. 2022)]MCG3108776.1 hypothetical protein [Metallosphaera javensis (ex Hofmann et al. 2022)]
MFVGAFVTIYLLSFLIGIPARRIAWPNLIDRGISNLSKLIGGIYVSSVDFALILSLVNLYLSALAVFAGGDNQLSGFEAFYGAEKPFDRDSDICCFSGYNYCYNYLSNSGKSVNFKYYLPVKLWD